MVAWIALKMELSFCWRKTALSSKRRLSKRDEAHNERLVATPPRSSRASSPWRHGFWSCLIHYLFVKDIFFLRKTQPSALGKCFLCTNALNKRHTLTFMTSHQRTYNRDSSRNLSGLQGKKRLAFIFSNNCFLPNDWNYGFRWITA